MNIRHFMKPILTFATANSTKILTGIGALGVIGTAIVTGQASRKALILEEQIKDEYLERYNRGEIDSEEVPKMELIKRVAPVYVPTIVMGTVTIACIVGSSVISDKRNAVLASLYSASELAMREYRHKVIDTIGEPKERDVRDKIAKDHLERHPISTSQVVITGQGDTMCFDPLSGRYFKTNIDKLRKVQNEVNRTLISDMWVPLNDFYYKLGLDAIELGYDIGWDVDHPIEFRFSSQLDANENPCLVLDYLTPPMDRKY